MAVIEVTESIESFDNIKFPKTLYKYRDWEKDNHRTILTRREVYFAPPKSFVDPYDCKNLLRWDLLTHEDLLNRFLEESRKHNTWYSIEQHMEFAIRWANTTNVTDKEFVQKKQEEDFEEYNLRSGVLSLTAFCDLKAMWEDYSNKHTGICVGFEPKEMLRQMHTAVGKVEYYPELPIIYPAPKHPHSLQMYYQIFSKLEKWTFEQEFRTYIFSPGPLTKAERVKMVPVEGYKEIILGALMTDESIDDVIKSIPVELSHLKGNLKKAYINGDKIEIQDL